MENEFENVDLMQKDAPDVRFRGKLLGMTDSRKADKRAASRNSDRYTRLELYELPSGKWVAASVACSDRQGEVDIARVKLINEIAGEPEQTAVLEFFGWTWLAKEFADEMGWDHVQEIV